MSHFSDSAFTSSSASNSLVEPPLRDLDISIANGKIPGLLYNLQFVFVTLLLVGGGGGGWSS